jgi:hypothetical protein
MSLRHSKNTPASQNYHSAGYYTSVTWSTINNDA